MRVLLIIILSILASFTGQAQTPYPIPQNLGGKTTLVQNPNYGGFKGGLIPFTFSDTSSANSLAPYLASYCGAIIYCTDVQAVFYRGCYNGYKWIQIIPASSPLGVNMWRIGLTSGLFTSPVDPQTIGTGTNQGFQIATNSTTRLLIDNDGINRSAGAANKFLTYDTITKKLYYGDGGAGTSVTASNGLTKSSDDIKLGGTLIEPTSVNLGGFDLEFTGGAGTSEVSFGNPLNFGVNTSSGATISATATETQLTSPVTATRSSLFHLYTDSAVLKPGLGNYKIDSLNNETSQNVLQGWTSTSGADRGKVGYVTLGSGLSLSGGALDVNASAIAWTPTGNTGTNPSTNFAGTTDGTDFVIKANSIEFDRRVPYVGTDTGYFGYLINSNYVTSPSDFASQFTAYGGASSSTVAGGKELTVGATNFSQGFYVPNIWPATVLGTQTYRAVGIKTAANNGLMIAQEPRTTALNYWARIWIEFDFNTRTAAIKITNGLGTTTLATSSALASISTGDSVACEFAFDYDELTATITNLNTAATTSISHTFVAPNYAPTVLYPCLIVPLTTNPVVLQSMQFYLTAYKHPDFNFVGHSVLHGYSGVTRAELVPELARAAMPDYKIQVDAMGSMKIADVMLWIDEIGDIDATYVPLMIGANDAGTSDATFYSGYRTLRDAIVAGGSQVIHFGQLPQGAFDFTARNDSLKTLYESLGDVFIDIFPLLKNGSGYDYNPAYDVGDGIHPNAAGDSLIASQFYLAMSSILGAPVNQNYIDFAQRGNLQKVFSYETQQAFNSDLDIVDKHYVDSVASSGGVSSVAATGNDGISITGSPITTSGTLTFDLGTITPTGIQNASGTTSLPSYSFSNDVTVGLLLSPSACGSDSATRAVANIPGCSPLQIQNLNAGGVGGIDYYNNSGTLVAQNGINNSNNVFYYQNVASGGTHLFTIGATEAFKINNSTTIEIGNLAGSGTRMVEASSTGLLSATNAAPTSSTYTPTLDNTTNVSSSTPIVCHYIRVGNQVTVTGSVTLTTTGTGATVLGISLPIASNFGATTDCSGLGNATVPAGFSFGNYVEGSAANDRAELKFDAIAATSGTIFFVFTFTVI